MPTLRDSHQERENAGQDGEQRRESMVKGTNQSMKLSRASYKEKQEHIIGYGAAHEGESR